jgi:photosystem II stability/assembly factor-like uncharacterized protein
MFRNFGLKASLLVVMVALCVGVPIANAEVEPLNWTSPTTEDPSSVFMVSASDGWAVGGYGRIIHWDGTDWSNVTSPTTAQFLGDVFMVSADDGWAVGADGTIIHWDGTSWSNVTSPTTEHLGDVFMVSADDGWAVGNYACIRWTGTEWIPEFPTIVLMPLLISLTLVAVILAKTASKKRRKPSLPSKTLL